MLSVADLRRAVKNALAFASSQSDVSEVEVFASAGANLTVRLNYTSHIPSNGVEEPKSTEGYGLGIRATFRTPDGIKTGFGSEPTDLSVEGAGRALNKARAGAVADAEFVSLPKLDSSQKPNSKDDTPLANYDTALMRIGGKGLVDAGWRMMDRALDVFQSSEDLMGLAGSAEKMAELGLILGGDVVMLQDRMAIASTHIPRVQTEQNTLVMSFATAMIESRSSKGSGWSVGSRLADFTGEAAGEAARNAIESMDGRRIPSGDYNVVLGPQAVAEILEWVLMPGLSLDMFYAGASPFMGKLGQLVASEDFNLYDDGAAPGLPSSKSITDEGLPTGRTELIQGGKLSGLLADYYNHQRILNDPKGREKLGVTPADALRSIAPRNGFRPRNGGGRDFGSIPNARSSNLVIEGGRGHSQEELLRLVGDGVYIGRIWYTYPVNGTTSGDFSGTIIGDSYLIKDGRFAAPLKPNTVRMNDNALRLINNILGIAAQRRATVRWSSDQMTWAPEIAVSGFGLEEISEYMEGV
ncbi:MAG: TldD/PmbA family protein [Chloroflexi bacterium]|nr:TldD/PmbA family protein [Chloroflexota bacterium]